MPKGKDSTGGWVSTDDKQSPSNDNITGKTGNRNVAPVKKKKKKSSMLSIKSFIL